MAFLWYYPATRTQGQNRSNFLMASRGGRRASCILPHFWQTGNGNRYPLIPIWKSEWNRRIILLNLVLIPRRRFNPSTAHCSNDRPSCVYIHRIFPFTDILTHHQYIISKVNSLSQNFRNYCFNIKHHLLKGTVQQSILFPKKWSPWSYRPLKYQCLTKTSFNRNGKMEFMDNFCC